MAIEKAEGIVRAYRTALLESRREALLDEFFNVYKTINFEFEYDAPLWRSRKADNSDGYSHHRDLHLPPPPIASANRLNDSGNPVLYLSLNQFSTFAEVRAKPGGHIHIAAYVIKSSQKIRCAVVGEVYNVYRSARATTCDMLTTEINRLLSNSGYREARSLVYMDAFVADLLSNPNAAQEGYEASRSVARRIFWQNPDVDAIWYPGIALQNGVNFAVKPESADRILEMKFAHVVRVDRVFEYGIYDFTVVRQSGGIEADGTFKWVVNR